MIIKNCLNNLSRTLASNNIEDASLESELLVRQLMNYSRIELYQNIESKIPSDKQENLQTLLQRRLSGEPSAYISANREFFGYDFYVDKHVLIPRPETEHLVEKTISLAGNYNLPVIADIGTGSGAIAISLALSLQEARIFAVDISFDALKTADINCHRYGVNDRIKLLCGDLLEPLPEKADIITANLPYVRTYDVPINTFEPKLALDGGDDGLDVIRRICSQLIGKIKGGGYLLLEIGIGQKEGVINLLKAVPSFNDIEVIPDMRGIDRIICASFK